MHTPEIFVRAADWAHTRDYGCPAGVGLRRVLLELTGPPRVGACTLDGPVPIPGSWEVREVSVAWPATTPGIDVLVLVHPGPLTAPIRSRVAAGPQAVVVVPALPGSVPFSPELLPRVRARLLHGELRALAARHPHLAGELRAVAGAGGQAPRTPRVAVISPDPAVRVELPGMEVVADAHVDAVLALAPAAGWTAADHPTLRDAARRAGRLVSTAPLPADVPGVLARPGRPLVEAVRHALTLPAAPLPAPRPGTWLRAADQLERRRRLLLDAHLADLVARREVEGLALLAERHGVPPAPPPARREAAAQAAVVAAFVGAAAGRAAWGWSPVAAVLAGAIAALAAGGVRWRRGRREALAAWAATEAARIRRAPAPAPAVWLRRTLSEETR